MVLGISIEEDYLFAAFRMKVVADGGRNNRLILLEKRQHVWVSLCCMLMLRAKCDGHAAAIRSDFDRPNVIQDVHVHTTVHTTRIDLFNHHHDRRISE